MMSVPVMSAGIKSGVNWIRRNARSIRPRERADHGRFGEAGHALEQAMSSGENSHDELLDDLMLARR